MTQNRSKYPETTSTATRGSSTASTAAWPVDVADPDQMGRAKVSCAVRLPAGALQVWARPCFPPGHFFVPPVRLRRSGSSRGRATSELPALGRHLVPAGNGAARGRQTVGRSATSCTRRPGHVVELGDENGKEKLVIRHKVDSFVSIDEKGAASSLLTRRGSYLYLNADKAGGQCDERTGAHGHARRRRRDRRAQRRLAHFEITDGKVIGHRDELVCARSWRRTSRSLAARSHPSRRQRPGPGGAGTGCSDDVQHAHPRFGGRPDRAAAEAADAGPAGVLALSVKVQP